MQQLAQQCAILETAFVMGRGSYCTQPSHLALFMLHIVLLAIYVLFVYMYSR